MTWNIINLNGYEDGDLVIGRDLRILGILICFTPIVDENLRGYLRCLVIELGYYNGYENEWGKT